MTTIETQHGPSWPAPAKLNLFLQITGRRADGYHALQTVFQFLSVGDELRFGVREDGVIRRLAELPAVPAEQDLVVRAARLLQEHSGCRLGADIHLSKQLPLGGGLGGGSSDAATTLVVLNQLWGLRLDQDQLAQLGLQLGADVPVFVRGRAAWATGVGERLESIDLPEPYYLVIDPGVSVSTAEIFAARELTRNCDPLTIRAFLRGAGSNVCEPVVRARYPQVAEALDWLGQHGEARMSGSGGCVFAAFDSHAQAEDVKSRVARKWVAYVARAINVNPVHRQLGLPV